MKTKIMHSILLVMSITIQGAGAQQLADNKIPMDPKVKVGQLPNGLTYYIRENSEPRQRAELNLVIKAGSLQETEEQKGLAHFTEHMAFNGTRSYPKNELIDYLQKAGIRFGADLNAYTGFDKTVYQLPIPTDDPKLFENAFTILSEWAGAITFEGEEIDKERGVVVAEERQRGKNVSERLSKQLLPVLLADSRHADRLPIGEIEIIENFEHETLKAYYNKWYRPDLMAVIAVGDFDVAKVEALIRKNFAGLKSRTGSPEPGTYRIPSNEEPLVKIATDPEFPYTVASVIYKHPEQVVRSEKDFRNSIIRSAASSILSSRIQELINSGSAPFLNAGVGYGPFQGGMVGTDAFTIQVVAKKPESLKQSIAGVMDEVRKVLQFGFTQTELDRVKTNFMASVEKSLKEKDKVASKAYLNQYINHFNKGAALIGMEYSHSFYATYLEGIRLEEVNAMASSFVRPTDQIILVQGPEKSKEVFPDPPTLVSWVNDDSRRLSAYVDDVVDAPLIKTQLEASSISVEKYHKSINTTEIMLSNGVKVLLKPTDFKNDEILFSAISPGGVSLAAEENLSSAKMADDIIGASGVGRFSSVQLRKMLAGKSLGVSPYIGMYSEGVRGSSSPKDIETALELLYLYFTQPRTDSAAYKRILENKRVAIKGKSSNPMAVFQDTVNTALKGRGAYAQSLSLEQVDQVDLQQSETFFKQRFSDASDFTFVFVGNFKNQDLLPLIQNYLGGLPSQEGEEHFRDVGIAPLEGEVSKKVYRGLEDKALVVLSLHDEYKYSRRNNLRLKALESVLKDRVMKRLREKETGVYSPSVSLSYTKIPRPYYSLSVSFSCATDQVDSLVKATKEEIEKIRKQGPDEAELEKFVAQELRQHQVALRTNSFWLGYLRAIHFSGKDPERVHRFETDLKNLKRRTIRKAGRTFLSTEGQLELYLLPEELKSGSEKF